MNEELEFKSVPASFSKAQALADLLGHRLGEDMQIDSILVAAVEELKDLHQRLSDAQEPWAGLMQETDKVVIAKGRDYTKGSSDRLANFRQAAKDAGITPLQAWLVFFNKHVAAICNFVKTGGQSESEPIMGRFVDVLNYLRLGWLLVLDLKRQQPTKISSDMG